MKSLRCLVFNIGLLLLFVLQPVLHSTSALAEASKISEASQNLLQGMADTLHGQDAITRTLLVQLGFPPKDAPPHWNHWDLWPSVRMLEAAYASAEAARPGVGGEELLRKFTRLLAANHIDAIRLEPAFQHVFPEPRGEPINEALHVLPFSVPAPEVLDKPLPAEIRAHIKIVTRYTAHLYRPWLFARCCAVNEDETYEIMRHQPRDEAVIEAALGLKPPPPSTEDKLALLIQDVHQDNPAIAFEPGLESRFHPVTARAKEADLREANTQVSKAVQDLLPAFLEDKPLEPKFQPPGPFPDATPPSSPGAPPIVPPPGESAKPTPRGSPMTASERSYRVFQQSRYPSPGRSGWTFPRMIARVMGFGGVIFGNEWSVQQGLSPVVNVSWVDGAKAAAPMSSDVVEQWGRLVFKLKDGSILFSHEVRADTVIAAKAVVDSLGESANSGVGLVGFIGRFAKGSFDSSGKLANLSPGASFVVHPAVVSTRFGRAMMVLDTLPMTSDRFIQQFSDSGAQKAEVESLKRILKGGYGELGQYKFTDVKLHIFAGPANTVSVKRLESDLPGASQGVRTKAYITLRSFDGDKPRSEGAVPLYSLVPTLVQVSDPFSRANEFAEVFALLRWAKSTGGTWFGHTPPGSGLGISTALVVDEDGGYTFGPSAEAFSQDFANRIHSKARAIALSSGNGNLLSLTDKLHTKFSDLISSTAALRTAGTAIETLGSAFSADPGLAKLHPEMAREALDATTFRRGDFESLLKQMVAEEWINEHIEDMEHVLPGLKKRNELTKHVIELHSDLKSTIGDPFKLFAKLTEGKFKKDIADLTDEVKSQSPNEGALDVALEKLLQFMDRNIPGFSDWFEQEAELLRILGK
jgi:hypothetical protein